MIADISLDRWNGELTEKLDVAEHGLAHCADLVVFKCFIEFVSEAWVSTSHDKEVKRWLLGRVWIWRELGAGVQTMPQGSPDRICEYTPYSLAHLFEVVPPGKVDARVFSQFLPTSASVVH